MDIKQKQHALGFLGYYRLTVDGKWGSGSRQATLEFQRDYGLEADGIFGPATEERIRHVIGNDEEPEYSWEKAKYFKREEFICRCGGRFCSGYPVEPDMMLIRLLDRVREHFGKPVIIHSGIRCERYNEEIGGAPKSQHKLGKAADFHVKGVPNDKVLSYLQELLPETGGIGIYSWGIHADVRELKARWDAR